MDNKIMEGVIMESINNFLSEDHYFLEDRKRRYMIYYENPCLNHYIKYFDATKTNRMGFAFVLSSYYSFEEAWYCFIYGRFSSSILMTAVSLEAFLCYHLYQSEKIENKTLGSLIKIPSARKILGEYTTDAKAIINNRNDVIHLNYFKEKTALDEWPYILKEIGYMMGNERKETKREFIIQIESIALDNLRILDKIVKNINP